MSGIHILKQKEQSIKANILKGVSTCILKKQRHKIMEEVEKLLLVCINNKQKMLASASHSFVRIVANHRRKPQEQASAASDFVFKASQGWFEKLRHRKTIHSITRHGEEAGLNKAGSWKFLKNLEKS